MAEDQYVFKNKGLAVIIVNENFQEDDLVSRSCATKDLEMSSKTFEDLGFEVRLYHNQTATQMLYRIIEGLYFIL